MGGKGSQQGKGAKDLREEQGEDLSGGKGLRGDRGERILIGKGRKISGRKGKRSQGGQSRP